MVGLHGVPVRRACTEGLHAEHVNRDHTLGLYAGPVSRACTQCVRWEKSFVMSVDT